jgi:hypothetical protein
MANNRVSYQRFTALPPNIAQYGATVEELELQRGKPDPNPILSPMPEARVADVRLALTPAGSDRMRLAMPVEPELNPYEGPRSVLGLTRSAHKKLTGNTLGELQKAVQSAELTPETKSLMADSIRRALVGLGQYLGDNIRLSEAVYARCLAASKG